MKCTICGNAKGWLAIYTYDKPDKYEKWVGIDRVNRTWVKCLKCGFLQQVRNYPIWQVEAIYKNGYRHPKFRGETIEDAFNRIIETEDNENEIRYIWFGSNVQYKYATNVLDIGSGIGVWPWILDRAEYNVTCVEENQHSIDFLNSKLGITCYKGLDSIIEQYDVVTLVHVLEHIEELDSFLKQVTKHIRPGGYLFVEVPDAKEFEYLESDNDEFNSCHVSFFDVPSLYKLLERNGLEATNIRRVHYKDRDLSRIMYLGEYHGESNSRQSEGI